MIKEVLVELVRATPGTAASGIILFSIPLTSWVVILTLFLVASQIFFLYRKELRRKNGNS